MWACFHFHYFCLQHISYTWKYMGVYFCIQKYINIIFLCSKKFGENQMYKSLSFIDTFYYFQVYIKPSRHKICHQQGLYMLHTYTVGEYKNVWYWWNDIKAFQILCFKDKRERLLFLEKTKSNQIQHKYRSMSRVQRRKTCIHSSDL